MTCIHRHQRPSHAVQKGAHVVGGDGHVPISGCLTRARAGPGASGGPWPMRDGAPSTCCSHAPSGASTALLQHHCDLREALKP